MAPSPRERLIFVAACWRIALRQTERNGISAQRSAYAPQPPRHARDEICMIQCDLYTLRLSVSLADSSLNVYSPGPITAGGPPPGRPTSNFHYDDML